MFFLSSNEIDLFKFNKVFIKYKGILFFPTLLRNIFLLIIMILKNSYKLLKISSKMEIFNLLLFIFPLSLLFINSFILFCKALNLVSLHLLLVD